MSEEGQCLIPARFLLYDTSRVQNIVASVSAQPQASTSLIDRSSAPKTTSLVTGGAFLGTHLPSSASPALSIAAHLACVFMLPLH